MQAFAEYLHVKLQLVDAKYDGLIPALNTSKFDMIVSGIAISPERSQVVNFSEPYYTVHLGALVLNENINKYKNILEMPVNV